MRDLDKIDYLCAVNILNNDIMKRFIGMVALVASVVLSAVAQPEGKKIYIPRDLRNNDFSQDSSQWSYSRMACTKDFVVFWEKPYGNDLSKAPALDGHDMTVDLPNLLEKLQTFYDYYRDSLRFILPGSKADEYRMMAMINYSLESTAYGGAYDDVIGALWITPSRLRDRQLNAVAHEVGHSFQSQIYCDGYPRGMNGAIYEMTSQWMLWHVNPLWMDDETYHWNDYRKLTHLRFLHSENRYHTAHVQEYWSEKRGLTVMADLFRECKRHEDCAEAYMRHFGLSLDQMSDEMLDCACHILAMDYKRLKPLVSKYAFKIHTPAETDADGWMRPKEGYAPQIFGFDVFRLPVEGSGKLRVKVESLTKPGEGGVRYALVMQDTSGNIIYGPRSGKQRDELQYSNDGIAAAYLVVLGAPAEYKTINQRYNSAPREQTFPFRFRVR